MKDIHGQAILDYYNGERNEPLILHNSYGEPEAMPVEVFFREPIDFTDLENQAISECRGKTLDIGAGAGAMSLLLQGLEFDVTAIENSPGCIETMKALGVRQVIDEDYAVHHGKYDTLFMSMNGIGIIGKLDKLGSFFKNAKNLLNPSGQIVLDSSDIEYLYQDDLAKPDHYYGEVSYCYEYKGTKGEWFDWVYIDSETLKKEVLKMGLNFEKIEQTNTDQYLARITNF